jgi:hypothetical protein
MTGNFIRMKKSVYVPNIVIDVQFDDWPSFLLLNVIIAKFLLYNTQGTRRDIHFSI